MRSAARHQHTLKLQHKCQQHDHIQRQKVYLISLTYMANRIGETITGFMTMRYIPVNLRFTYLLTADDLHGWIFAEVVYD